jgi:hypothetical protein
MAERKWLREYHYQSYFVSASDPDKGDWVDVAMYPPGTGESPSTPKEVWVAYLAYLRVVHPDSKYRLVESVTTTVTEVLDV